MDAATFPEFDKEMAELMAQGGKNFIIDFGELDYISSAGLRSILVAAKKLKEKEFDAIISDYQMPEKNGLEFLRELREKGNKIPLILFTGKGREEVTQGITSAFSRRRINNGFLSGQNKSPPAATIASAFVPIKT